ncbi:hypothetical protein [Kitasatospora griseola]|uniref:hypothetical protein n=1 Tax=Kitasatospora griseola TaxID=2064 RepID=UPI0038190419
MAIAVLTAQAVPGSSSSAYRLVDGTGTFTVDLAAAGNPVALANSVHLRGAAKSGFSLTDAAGHSVQLSAPGVTLLRFATDGRIRHEVDYWAVHLLLDQIGLGALEPAASSVGSSAPEGLRPLDPPAAGIKGFGVHPVHTVYKRPGQSAALQLAPERV